MKNITFLMPKINLELACDLLLSFEVHSTTIENLDKEISRTPIEKVEVEEEER